MFEWLKKKPEEKSAPSGAARPAHPLLELVLEQLALREDDVVLQVGFGADLDLLVRLVPELDKGRLVGIEANPAALARAVRVFDEEFSSFKADFKNAVVSKIPFYDGFFTKAASLDQLPSWINPDKAFDEINRVLAPGGIFALAWKRAQGDAFGPDEVASLLKAAGFYRPELRERDEGGLRHFLLTSRKL
jgi:ubiquinone/menaquinone biosynthesis C-methylase UbiE